MEQSYQRRPVEVALPPHGVFVLESHHAPDFRMSAQCHDFMEIFYVLKGIGVFGIDDRRHPAQAGDILFVPTGRVHRIEDNPSEPLALYGICIAPAVLRHEPTLLQHLPPGLLPTSKPLTVQVRADLRQLLFEQTLTRPGRNTLMLGLTLQLLTKLARSHFEMLPPAAPTDASSDHRKTMSMYIAELTHRFFEATDLDHAASELAMSRRLFTQLFREITGASWSSYLTRLRIDYACRLLADSSRSILSIAFESGYEDLSSFYRAFKRHRGMPPHTWRTTRAESNDA